jgi:oligoribonuclease (3'-5' exoribonuclease)
MSDKVVAMHTKNGLFAEIIESGVSVIEAEARVVISLKQLIEQVPQTRIILAGFSVHYDRSIINRDMLQLDALLHYRHFDVSVLRSAYHFWVEPIPSKKSEHPHRVKADILAAWEISKSYKKLFQDHFPKGLIASGVQL